MPEEKEDSEDEEPLPSPPPVQEVSPTPTKTTRYGRKVRAPTRFNPSRGYVAHQRERLYIMSLALDPDKGTLEDPSFFALKTKRDPDRPSYREAMLSEDAEGYGKAMGEEVKGLEKQETWEFFPRSQVPKGKRVLPGIWAFLKKRFPDGRVRKLKARYCVRGDLQTEGVDYFETYAPVVSWSTVRLLLILAIVYGLASKQADFSNAFAQAKLEEEIYIELPQGFQHPDGQDVVLKLNKSLYGLKQAALCWYELLKKGLESVGFKAKSTDPCLFIHPDVICLVYVDDCLFFAKDVKSIDAVLQKLKNKGFALTVEGDVNAFLGIDISRSQDGCYVLKQPGLIQRVLQATKMADCHARPTPAGATPLGKDAEGMPRKEEWSYPSIIGMMLYLSTNSRPDIAFAVHQCARFTHSPLASHEEGVKRICRYLKGTQDKGMIVKPTGELKIDCFVDSDFAGLWRQEDDQDPVCVKSRTGYVLMLAGCPLLWVSKLQTEIALSTMESEYIALSQSMRDVIPMRQVTQDVIGSLVPASRGSRVEVLTRSTIFEDNDATRILALSPKLTPRSKHIAIKYHFFREKIASGEINIERVDSSENVADIFTKGLDHVKFQAMRKKLIGW
jgi:hypothetical protein